MRPYEDLKKAGNEELERIEGIFGNKSKYLSLKKEEKTSLMQDYIYLYCKTLPQFDPKMDRRMYGEIKINRGLEKTFERITKASYDGKGVTDELRSSLIVEYAAGVSLYGKKDVKDRIEKYNNDIRFSLDKVRGKRAAEQVKPDNGVKREPAAKTQSPAPAKAVKIQVRKRPKLNIQAKSKQLVNSSYELDNHIKQMRAQIKEMEKANKSLFSSSRKYDATIRSANALLELTEKYKKLGSKDLSPAQRKSIAEQLLENCQKMQNISLRYYDRKKEQGKLDDLYVKTDRMDKDSQKRVYALVGFDRLIDSLKRTVKRNKTEAKIDVRNAKAQKEDQAKINARLDGYDEQAENLDDVQKNALNEAYSRIEQVMNDNMIDYQNGNTDFDSRKHKEMEYCAAAVMVNDLIRTDEGIALKKIAPTDPAQYKSFIRGITDSKSFKRSLPEGLNTPKGLSAFLADKNASLDMGKAYMKDMQAEIKASHNNIVRTSDAPKHEAGKVLK